MASVAVSIARYWQFFQKQQVARVLDYGAGTLRNATYLTDHGFSVFAADLPEQVVQILRREASKRLAGVLRVEELPGAELEVDLVVSTYVLNIVPDGSEKSRYLKNIVLNLRPDGYLLIEAACRRSSAQCGTECSFQHKCSKCLKTYSHDELDQLLSPYGFKRLSHYYRRQSLSVLYQLVNA